MKLTPPAEFSCEMCAHERKGPGASAFRLHRWRHIYPSAVAVRMCDPDAPVWKVKATVDPKGIYWGWWVPDRAWISMIQPTKDLLGMCFPYGLSAAEEAGQGHRVRVRIEAIEPVGPGAQKLG